MSFASQHRRQLSLSRQWRQKRELFMLFIMLLTTVFCWRVSADAVTCATLSSIAQSTSQDNFGLLDAAIYGGHVDVAQCTGTLTGGAGLNITTTAGREMSLSFVDATIGGSGSIVVWVPTAVDFVTITVWRSRLVCVSTHAPVLIGLQPLSSAPTMLDYISGCKMIAVVFGSPRATGSATPRLTINIQDSYLGASLSIGSVAMGGTSVARSALAVAIVASPPSDFLWVPFDVSRALVLTLTVSNSTVTSNMRVEDTSIQQATVGSVLIDGMLALVNTTIVINAGSTVNSTLTRIPSSVFIPSRLLVAVYAVTIRSVRYLMNGSIVVHSLSINAIVTSPTSRGTVGSLLVLDSMSMSDWHLDVSGGSVVVAYAAQVDAVGPHVEAFGLSLNATMTAAAATSMVSANDFGDRLVGIRNSSISVSGGSSAVISSPQSAVVATYRILVEPFSASRNVELIVQSIQCLVDAESSVSAMAPIINSKSLVVNPSANFYVLSLIVVAAAASVAVADVHVEAARRTSLLSNASLTNTVASIALSSDAKLVTLVNVVIEVNDASNVSMITSSVGGYSRAMHIALQCSRVTVTGLRLRLSNSSAIRFEHALTTKYRSTHIAMFLFTNSDSSLHEFVGLDLGFQVTGGSSIMALSTATTASLDAPVLRILAMDHVGRTKCVATTTGVNMIIDGASNVALKVPWADSVHTMALHASGPSVAWNVSNVAVSLTEGSSLSATGDYMEAFLVEAWSTSATLTGFFEDIHISVTNRSFVNAASDSTRVVVGAIVACAPSVLTLNVRRTFITLATDSRVTIYVGAYGAFPSLCLGMVVAASTATLDIHHARLLLEGGSKIEMTTSRQADIQLASLSIVAAVDSTLTSMSLQAVDLQVTDASNVSLYSSSPGRNDEALMLVGCVYMKSAAKARKLNLRNVTASVQHESIVTASCDGLSCYAWALSFGSHPFDLDLLTSVTTVVSVSDLGVLVSSNSVVKVTAMYVAFCAAVSGVVTSSITQNVAFQFLGNSTVYCSSAASIAAVASLCHRSARASHFVSMWDVTVAGGSALWANSSGTLDAPTTGVIAFAAVASLTFNTDNAANWTVDGVSLAVFERSVVSAVVAQRSHAAVLSVVAMTVKYGKHFIATTNVSVSIGGSSAASVETGSGRLATVGGGNAAVAAILLIDLGGSGVYTNFVRMAVMHTSFLVTDTSRVRAVAGGPIAGTTIHVLSVFARSDPAAVSMTPATCLVALTTRNLTVRVTSNSSVEALVAGSSWISSASVAAVGAFHSLRSFMNASLVAIEVADASCIRVVSSTSTALSFVSHGATGTFLLHGVQLTVTNSAISVASQINNATAVQAYSSSANTPRLPFPSATIMSFVMDRSPFVITALQTSDMNIFIVRGVTVMVVNSTLDALLRLSASRNDSLAGVGCVWQWPVVRAPVAVLDGIIIDGFAFSLTDRTVVRVHSLQGINATAFVGVASLGHVAPHDDERPVLIGPPAQVMPLAPSTNAMIVDGIVLPPFIANVSLVHQGVSVSLSSVFQSNASQGIAMSELRFMDIATPKWSSSSSANSNGSTLTLALLASQVNLSCPIGAVEPKWKSFCSISAGSLAGGTRDMAAASSFVAHSRLFVIESVVIASIMESGVLSLFSWRGSLDLQWPGFRVAFCDVRIALEGFPLSNVTLLGASRSSDAVGASPSNPDRKLDMGGWCFVGHTLVDVASASKESPSNFNGTAPLLLNLSFCDSVTLYNFTSNLEPPFVGWQRVPPIARGMDVDLGGSIVELAGSHAGAHPWLQIVSDATSLFPPPDQNGGMASPVVTDMHRFCSAMVPVEMMPLLEVPITVAPTTATSPNLVPESTDTTTTTQNASPSTSASDFVQSTADTSKISTRGPVFTPSTAPISNYTLLPNSTVTSSSSFSNTTTVSNTTTTGPVPTSTLPTSVVVTAVALSSVTALAASSTLTVVSVFASPADSLQSSRVFSSLRSGACAVGNHSTSLSSFLPFPRSVVPVSAGPPEVGLAIGAILGNVGLVVASAAVCLLTSWFRASSTSKHPPSDAAGNDLSNWDRRLLHWQKSRFPSVPISVSLFTIDGVAFASTFLFSYSSLPLGDGRVTPLPTFVPVIASAGVVFCCVVFLGSFTVTAKNPLVFTVSTPLTDSDTARQGLLIRLLSQRRGQWLPAPNTDAPIAAVELVVPIGGVPTSAQAVADSSIPVWVTTYRGLFRPLIAGVRGGQGLLAHAASWGIALDVCLTVLSSVLEARSAAACDAGDAASAVNVGIAAVSAVFLLVAAPHPLPLKAVLAALSAVTSLAVATLMHVARRSKLDEATAFATAAQRTATLGAAISGVSVAVTVAAAIIRQRRKRRNIMEQQEGAARRPPGIDTMGNDEYRHDTPMLSAVPTKKGAAVNPMGATVVAVSNPLAAPRVR